MPTVSRQKSRRAYDDKTKQLIFRLRADKDADIIEKFESVPNKTEYLRELIRRDIRENTNEQ
jgi:hypothetical protein